MKYTYIETVLVRNPPIITVLDDWWGGGNWSRCQLTAEHSVESLLKWLSYWDCLPTPLQTETST